MDSKVWDQEYWLPATKHEKELEKIDWTYKVQYPEGQELQANCNFVCIHTSPKWKKSK